MRHWIFQGNLDKFDVDGYLEQTDTLIWNVRQQHLATLMTPGDKVFIWRGAGRSKKDFGVVATANITSSPTVQPEDESSFAFWKEGDPSAAELRVSLKLERLFNGDSEMVKGKWLVDDPVLKELRILHFRNQTNYDITEQEAQRLTSLVDRTEQASVSEAPIYSDLGPPPADDADELQQFARRVRRGQPKFRKQLLKAYGNRCAISGWGPEDVLEAAHIEPHAKSGKNSLDNGLLLRADLHTLLDYGLLRISPNDCVIEVDETLLGTDYHKLYHGRRLRDRVDGGKPGHKHLLAKYKKASESG